ncbi:MAG TPA: helix-hairpin-helix domain-containing protein [Gammaproteobacteria bacterium]|nr:helix-hairpin-helix domain-containing protein [Gammaproteobacteria bacterium]
MRSLRRLVLTLSLICLSLTAPLAAFAEPVDLNTADAHTLAVALKGIGPSKAKAIIAYRELHGPFKSVDDLQSVKGIGAKTVESNRDAITVADPRQAEADK